MKQYILIINFFLFKEKSNFINDCFLKILNELKNELKWSSKYLKWKPIYKIADKIFFSFLYPDLKL